MVGLAKGDATRDDSQRRFLSTTQRCNICWNQVVTIRTNVASMLQHCVVLKMIVANRLVSSITFTLLGKSVWACQLSFTQLRYSIVR